MLVTLRQKLNANHAFAYDTLPTTTPVPEPVPNVDVLTYPDDDQGGLFTPRLPTPPVDGDPEPTQAYRASRVTRLQANVGDSTRITLYILTESGTRYFKFYENAALGAAPADGNEVLLTADDLPTLASDEGIGIDTDVSATKEQRCAVTFEME